MSKIDHEKHIDFKLLREKGQILRRQTPLDSLGLPRASIVELYNSLLKGGLIGPPETEGEFFREVSVSFGVHHLPKSGWTNLGYELRLINIVLPEKTKTYTKGRSDLANQCKKNSNEIWKIISDISLLSQSSEIQMAQIDCELVLTPSVLELVKLRQSLEKIASHLKKSRQPPKWRAANLRRMRVELATRLAPLFENEFGSPARPVGGSASMELEETNDWTRFYQAIAFVFLDEKVSPDRQAILWEAASSA